jgi:PAS domain-containing protein
MMDATLVAYYRAILNALPLMVFVVDQDVRIRDLNDEAATAFGLEKGAVLDRRGGEVLRCLHSSDVPEGCGRAPACRLCVIRSSVSDSQQGGTITRRRTRFTRVQETKRKDLDLLITTSPMPGADESLTLLAIDDISEISALRDLIPICMKCKRIRDDQRYWHSVESYFSGSIGVDFTHGVCPACEKELLLDVESCRLT